MTDKHEIWTLLGLDKTIVLLRELESLSERGRKLIEESLTKIKGRS